MFSFTSKIRGASISHPLARSAGLAAKVSDEEAQSLAHKLRAGDEPDVIAETTMRYTRLAISIASRYAAKHPKCDPGDLVSEAVLGMIEACQPWIVWEMDNDNLTAFLSMKMHSKVLRFIRRDHAVPIPHRTNARHNYSIVLPPQMRLSAKIPCRRASSMHGLIEVKDMIEQSITNANERRVIEMRAAEMVDREIAQAIGLSVSRVAQIRSGVTERFLALEAECQSATSS